MEFDEKPRFLQKPRFYKKKPRFCKNRDKNRGFRTLTYTIAVNDEYIDPESTDIELCDKSTIAIIPPLSGG